MDSGGLLGPRSLWAVNLLSWSSAWRMPPFSRFELGYMHTYLNLSSESLKIKSLTFM